MDSTNYLVIQLSFGAITLFFVGWFVKEIFLGIDTSALSPDQKRKFKFRIVAGLLTWLVLVSALSISGVLLRFSSFPPPIAVVLLIPLVAVIIITSSATLKQILKSIPPRNLIRLQVFRVFVEVLLWMLLTQNLMPVQMSFEGRNFDVLTGLTAPFIAYGFAKYKSVMVIWNFIGLGLLVNILSIAILSMPTPFRVFMNEPANTIVAHFPIVFLPAFLVPLAYTLHFFSLRQLLSKSN